MGRFYEGDIEGKLWFAVQSSDDASNFGGRMQEKEDEGVLTFIFTKEDVPSISDGIMRCVDELGANKEKLDEFFNSRGSYQFEDVADCLGIERNKEAKTPDINLSRKVIKILEPYARLKLGEKILACVEAKGRCEFDAEL